MCNRLPLIGVIGAGECSDEVKNNAYLVGKTIAENGGIMVCGGLGGVMEAAAKGAKENSGITIGILPSVEKSNANKFIDIVIPTGMGKARNIIIVNMADALVALPGKYGTLTEIAFALHMNKPIISVSSWSFDEQIIQNQNPVEAVHMVMKLIGAVS